MTATATAKLNKPPDAPKEDYRLDCGRELKEALALFKGVPEADVVKCRFGVDHMDRFPAVVEVTASKRPDGGIGIVALDSLYPDRKPGQAENIGPPELKAITTVEIDKNGKLVLAKQVWLDSNEILDSLRDKAQIGTTVSMCYLQQVGYYVNGNHKSNSASVEYLKEGQVVKTLDVGYNPKKD